MSTRQHARKCDGCCWRESEASHMTGGPWLEVPRNGGSRVRVSPQRRSVRRRSRGASPGHVPGCRDLGHPPVERAADRSESSCSTFPTGLRAPVRPARRPHLPTRELGHPGSRPGRLRWIAERRSPAAAAFRPGGLGAQHLGAGADQRLDLPLALRACLRRPAAGHPQLVQRRHRPHPPASCSTVATKSADRSA
jgi:hypothetical protein